MSIVLDVIVRTMADAPRSESLFRALDSIQDQSGVEVQPIVVVNGQKFDASTLAVLENRPGILLHRVQHASAGLALVAGRRLVTAPFFAYLDDDDELIAGSLLGPLKWLESYPECDVLISNGHFVKDDGTLSELIHIADHLRVDSPALSLLEDSWLQPGAFIFRTEGIPPSMMDSGWSHMEWTHLAFELCAEHKRLHFMDVKTVRYYDTPGSMSKQTQHQEAALDLLQSVRRDARMGHEVQRKADEKYFRTLHNLALTYWEQGQHLRAWRCHLGSLRPPHTFRYLLFSRKLIWPFGIRHRRKVL